jgi:hypothetical protein
LNSVWTVSPQLFEVCFQSPSSLVQPSSLHLAVTAMTWNSQGLLSLYEV